jgi:hypothetical protein
MLLHHLHLAIASINSVNGHPPTYTSKAAQALTLLFGIAGAVGGANFMWFRDPYIMEGVRGWQAVLLTIGFSIGLACFAASTGALLAFVSGSSLSIAYFRLFAAASTWALATVILGIIGEGLQLVGILSSEPFNDLQLVGPLSIVTVILGLFIGGRLGRRTYGFPRRCRSATAVGLFVGICLMLPLLYWAFGRGPEPWHPTCIRADALGILIGATLGGMPAIMASARRPDPAGFLLIEPRNSPRTGIDR